MGAWHSHLLVYFKCLISTWTRPKILRKTRATVFCFIISIYVLGEMDTSDVRDKNSSLSCPSVDSSWWRLSKLSFPRGCSAAVTWTPLFHFCRYKGVLRWNGFSVLSSLIAPASLQTPFPFLLLNQSQKQQHLLKCRFAVEIQQVFTTQGKRKKSNPWSKIVMLSLSLSLSLSFSYSLLKTLHCSVSVGDQCDFSSVCCPNSHFLF